MARVKRQLFLKSDDELKAIPFVFHTATYSDARDKALALGLGEDFSSIMDQLKSGGLHHCGPSVLDRGIED